MITKQCAKCKRTIPYGIRYCTDCAPIAEREQAENKAKRTKQYNKQRDPKYKEFYDSPEWRTLRAVKLQRIRYTCEDCVAEKELRPKVAEDVHHDVPLSVDWERRLDIDNLVGVCVRHHNIREGRFSGYRNRRQATPTPRGYKKV